MQNGLFWMVGVTASLALLVAACGGDSSSETGQPTTTTGAPPLTASPELQAYFADLADLTATLDSEATRIFTALSATTDLDEAKDAFGQFPGVLETFIEGMRALDPPEETEAEHAASISAGEAYLNEARSANDGAQDARSVLDFAEPYNELTTGDAGPAFTSTCVALQVVADRHGVAVDLGCGS